MSLLCNTGHISGGSLKTPDQGDKESLQANWFAADTDQLPKKLHLRAPDILALIDTGKKWYESKPFSGLPVNVGHVSTSLRLVVTYCASSSDEGQVSVLVKGDAGSSSILPVVVCDIMLHDPISCLLYTSPSPRDATLSRMPSSA